jgi:hypothetical protein
VKKLLASLLLGLMLAGQASAAITYFGFASSIADNATGGFNTAGGVAVTPPASMTAGQFVLIWTVLKGDATSSLTMVAGDGQSWSCGSMQAFGTPDFLAIRYCLAQFNGTWSANPKVLASNAGNFSSETVLMLVANPTSASNTPAIDVVESGAIYAVPGSPFDITHPGQTSVAASTISVALFTSRASLPTWTLQTAGWANPGGIAQIRQGSNTDLSVSMAYKIQTSAAATGSLTNRQSSAAGGFRSMITIKEVASGPSWTTVPYVSSATDVAHVFSFQAASGTGTFWGEICVNGRAPPSIANLKAGLCKDAAGTGTEAALATCTKSITTAADTSTCTASSPQLIGDAYAVANLASADTALVSLPNQSWGPSSGYGASQPLVSICTASTCPVKRYNDAQAVDLAIGDYFSCTTSANPDSTIPLAYGTDGNFVLGDQAHPATSARESFICKYQDISAGTMAAGSPTTFYVNNTPPSCIGPFPVTARYKRNLAITPASYIANCSDVDGDALTAAVTAGTINTGLSLSSAGVGSGTPTVEVEAGNDFTITVTDVPGDTTNSATRIGVAETLTAPNCTSTPTNYITCAGMIETNGWLTSSFTYDYSNTVAIGNVISTTPTAATEVEPFTNVAMVVSVGKSFGGGGGKLRRMRARGGMRVR